jgi:hypothetical protein
MTIVGRTAELERIGALLTDGGALVLAGDAGIGKTALFEWGVARAGERGLRVLVARPAEGETALPNAALGDVLGDVDVDLPGAQRGALDRALAAGQAGCSGSRSRWRRSVCCGHSAVRCWSPSTMRRSRGESVRLTD